VSQQILLKHRQEPSAQSPAQHSKVSNNRGITPQNPPRSEQLTPCAETTPDKEIKSKKPLTKPIENKKTFFLIFFLFLKTITAF
jgi:hypothetical protein